MSLNEPRVNVQWYIRQAVCETREGRWEGQRNEK